MAASDLIVEFTRSGMIGIGQTIITPWLYEGEFQSISVVLNSDQPGLIYFEQSGNGSDTDLVDGPSVIVNGVPFQTTYTILSKWVRMRYQNTGLGIANTRSLGYGVMFPGHTGTIPAVDVNILNQPLDVNVVSLLPNPLPIAGSVNVLNFPVSSTPIVLGGATDSVVVTPKYHYTFDNVVVGTQTVTMLVAGVNGIYVRYGYRDVQSYASNAVFQTFGTNSSGSSFTNSYFTGITANTNPTRACVWTRALCARGGQGIRVEFSGTLSFGSRGSPFGYPAALMGGGLWSEGNEFFPNQLIDFIGFGTPGAAGVNFIQNVDFSIYILTAGVATLQVRQANWNVDACSGIGAMPLITDWSLNHHFRVDYMWQEIMVFSIFNTRTGGFSVVHRQLATGGLIANTKTLFPEMEGILYYDKINGMDNSVLGDFIQMPTISLSLLGPQTEWNCYDGFEFGRTFTHTLFESTVFNFRLDKTWNGAGVGPRFFGEAQVTYISFSDDGTIVGTAVNVKMYRNAFVTGALYNPPGVAALGSEHYTILPLAYDITGVKQAFPTVPGYPSWSAGIRVFATNFTLDNSYHIDLLKYNIILRRGDTLSITVQSSVAGGTGGTASVGFKTCY